jgi:hypothetical protein
MTKFNWEKTNKQERHNKFLFAVEDLSWESPSNRIEFDISNPEHNPLNLSDEDCRGKMPSEVKRNLIVKFLANNSELKFIEGDAINFDNSISSKDFYDFAWKLFTSSIDWTDKDSPEIKYVMPIAVCFSVVYLRIYNSVISPKSKASQLNFEIIKEMQVHLTNQKK